MTLQKPQQAKIIENKRLTKDIFLLKLKLSKPLDFKAGQYIQIIHKKIRRSFSIASSPKNKNHIELIIKKQLKGRLSPLLAKLKPNSKITIQGPFGYFTIKKQPKEIFFLSAGCGIAPFRSMINDLLENNTKSKIRLIYGFRTEQDYLFKKEWQNLEKKHKNFKITPTISRPQRETKLFKGHITDLLPDIPKSKEKEFYICGPKQMMKDTIKILELNFNKSQIYIEKWS